jgi:hypothetical protein
VRSARPYTLPSVIGCVACSLACGSSSPSGSNPPPDAAVDHRDGSSTVDAHAKDDSAQPHDGSPTDAPDTSDADPLHALASCLGASMPLTISGQMPYVDVPIGSYSGEFVLDFGSTFSSIDLSAFPSPGPMTSGCDPSELGVVCTVADFSFFSPPGDVSLTTEDYSGLGGSVRQAGILGTDFLSEHVITLGYADKVVYASPSSSFCTDSAMTAAGFASLSTAGFYENDLSLLEPDTDVDSMASSGFSVPNVPTVSVSVASASALAQLDTGFDDDVTPFSVNINPAFLAAIQAKSASAVVRDASLDGTLTTCVEGVDESVEAYRLGTGTTFDFVADGGGAARSYASSVLFVKHTPSAAASCGGIGTWTVPAAQVAASYFNDMKALAFDPYGARVWIPKR